MKNKKKISFVLGGGSIKGAYQVGQLKALAEANIIPDLVTGISVGSINAGLLAHLMYQTDGNFKLSVRLMEKVWKSIDNPKKLVKKKSLFKIAYEILFNKFNGFLDTRPLENLIYSNLNEHFIKYSPLQISVGSVDIDNGKIFYYGNGYHYIIKSIISSTRIPFLMPLSKISNNYYYDGGLIDNAGIGEAIDLGAEKIYVLATHTKNLKEPVKNKGNLFNLINRVMEIVVMNTLDNDIKLTELYNKFPTVMQQFMGKKNIKLKVFRPFEKININITSFNKNDINKMIENGYNDTKLMLYGDN